MRRVGYSAASAAFISVALLASPPPAKADPAAAAREAARAAVDSIARGKPGEPGAVKDAPAAKPEATPKVLNAPKTDAPKTDAAKADLKAEPKPADAAAVVTVTGEGKQAPTAATAAPAAEPPAPAEKVAEVKKAPPPVTLSVDIDLTRQRLTVTENGKASQKWAISSGRQGYETPTGRFRPGWMAKMWYSKQYDDAPMPHAVFFNGGIAVHGTSSTGMLGRPASHGCVRLSPGNAETFYKLVQKHSMAQTRIVVHGTAKQSEPAVARRREPNTYAQYPYRPSSRPMPGAYYYYPSGPYGYGYAPRYQPRPSYSYNDPYRYAPYRGRPYGYGYGYRVD